MDLFKNVIDISSEYGKNLDFYNFVEDVHKTIGCQKKECNIKSLLESLEAVIFNPNNIYDHQKKVFIEQCMKHPKVFGLMIQPRNNKGKTEAAIQRFHPTMRNLKEDSKCKNQLDQLFKEKRETKDKIEKLVDKINSKNG